MKAIVRKWLDPFFEIRGSLALGRASTIHSLEKPIPAAGEALARRHPGLLLIGKDGVGCSLTNEVVMMRV